MTNKNELSLTNSYVVFGDGAGVHTVLKRTKEGDLKIKSVEAQYPVVAEETIPKTNIFTQQNINLINLMFLWGDTCWYKINSYVVFGDGADVHTFLKRTKGGDLKKSKPVEAQYPVVAEETIPMTNILTQQNINQINQYKKPRNTG
ncbi:hypothetical protein RhiirB3_525867 [Rhizophagus irregularis]|nr:hypothetical protein RhiirB3_525867 [Rhizophagus irregularis]